MYLKLLALGNRFSDDCLLYDAARGGTGNAVSTSFSGATWLCSKSPCSLIVFGTHEPDSTAQTRETFSFNGKPDAATLNAICAPSERCSAWCTYDVGDDGGKSGPLEFLEAAHPRCQ